MFYCFQDIEAYVHMDNELRRRQKANSQSESYKSFQTDCFQVPMGPGESEMLLDPSKAVLGEPWGGFSFFNFFRNFVN